MHRQNASFRRLARAPFGGSPRTARREPTTAPPTWSCWQGRGYRAEFTARCPAWRTFPTATRGGPSTFAGSTQPYWRLARALRPAFSWRPVWNAAA